MADDKQKDSNDAIEGRDKAPVEDMPTKKVDESEAEQLKGGRFITKDSPHLML